MIDSKRKRGTIPTEKRQLSLTPEFFSLSSELFPRSDPPELSGPATVRRRLAQMVSSRRPSLLQFHHGARQSFKRLKKGLSPPSSPVRSCSSQFAARAGSESLETPRAVFAT